MTPKLWLEALDLAGLAGAPGPFATVVLATEAGIDNASQRNQLRWRGQRDALAEQGADEATLAAIDPLVDDAHLHGQTLVVVAGAGAVRHCSHWPGLPFREVARWDSLPGFGVVLERRQEAPPHVVVVADREGADITAVRHEAADIEVSAGGGEVLRKVHAGGWSQRRYEERAENSWETNAKDVAEITARLAQRVEARLVALAGDVRAVQMIREELPPEIGELVVDVGGSRATDGSPEADRDDLERLLAEAVARDTRALVEKLAEEVGQADRGRTGVAGTLSALRAAQVEVLLVRDDPGDDRRAWFAAGQPTVVAARREEVVDLGVEEDVRDGRLADVLIAAALASGAGVRMLDTDDGVDEGVGAILRWS